MATTPDNARLTMVNPFTTGHHRKIDNQANIHNQDSFMSAIVFGILLASASTTLHFFHFLTMPGTAGDQVMFITRLDLDCAISVLLITASCILMAIWIKRSNYVVPETSRSEDLEREFTMESLMMYVSARFRNLVRKGLPVFGLVIFFLSSSFIQLLRCLAHVTCMYTYLKCSVYVFSRYLINIIKHILIFIFMGVATGFSIKFNSRAFYGCTFIHYGLIIVSVTCWNIWLDVTLTDCADIYNLTDINDDYCATFGPNSSTDSECFAQKTDIHESVDKLEKYAEPLHIEFLLLFIEMVFHWFNSTEEEESSSNDTADDAETAPKTLEIYENHDSRDTVQNPTSSVGTQTDVQGSDIVIRRRIRGSAERLQQAVTARDQSNEYTMRGTMGFFMFSMLSGLLFFTTGLLTYMGTWRRVWVYVYEIANVAYFILSSVVCLYGFWATRNFASKYHEFHGLELMVLISIFGFAVHSVASIIASIMCLQNTYNIITNAHLEYPHLGLLVFLDFSADVVEVFFQAVFMVHASRVKLSIPTETYRRYGSIQNPRQMPRQSPSSEDDETTPLAHGNQAVNQTTNAELAARISQKRLFLNVVLHLVVSNIFLWICDSFVQMKNETVDPVQEFYYGRDKWELLKHITLPFTLFFRFNSAIIFAEIYLDS